MSELRLRPKYVTIRHASATGVADRWRSQYEKDGKWTTTAFGDSESVYKKLCALGPTPPIDSAAEIIGNKGWSYLFCDSCREYVTMAVALGESTYDEPKIYCEQCLREAVHVLDLLSPQDADRNGAAE